MCERQVTRFLNEPSRVASHKGAPKISRHEKLAERSRNITVRVLDEDARSLPPSLAERENFMKV